MSEPHPDIRRAHPPIEERVRLCLQYRLGGEVIDELPEAEQRKNMPPRADFLLCGRQVIAEVKEIRIDRIPAMRKILMEYRRASDWPPWQIDCTFGELARVHPRGRQLRDKVASAAMISPKRAIREAQRQIASTRLLFGIPSGRGLLVLVNEAIDVLDHGTVLSAINELKADPHGLHSDTMIRDLECIIHVNTTCVEVQQDGVSHHVVTICWLVEIPPYDDALHKLVNAFSSAWADVHGKPFLGTRELTAADFRKRIIEPLRSSTIDLDAAP